MGVWLQVGGKLITLFFLTPSLLLLPPSLLLCESTPVCGCFSNHRITLVFSGNVSLLLTPVWGGLTPNLSVQEDGSVVVWDLREPVAMHTRPPGATHTSQGLIPRFPTFNTGMRSLCIVSTV